MYLHMGMTASQLLHSAVPPLAVLHAFPTSLLCDCLQAGNAEDVAKYAKRTVRVTQQHNDECKRLLELMGVPIINVSISFECPAVRYIGLELLAACLVQVSHAHKH